MLDTAALLQSGALLPLWQGLQASSPFQPAQGWLLESPYHRPTDLSSLTLESLEPPLAPEALCTHRSLVLNRLLFNIYEQNNLYLPPERFSEQERRAFHGFYAPDLVAASALLRPVLEHTCFHFLSQAISVQGPWSMAHLEEYVQRLLSDFESTPSELCRRIRQAAHPRRAARLFLIQVAPDFLSEASQMARALPGNFGPVHSELMKIFIDEFGYGVHPQKHSTLFEETLASVGLSPRVHAYYCWYLPTSLLMTSYFHHVTASKTCWFEYVGALYWIEAVVPHFNRQFSRLLRDSFGPDTNTRYFDEHVGIDMHHRRMVFDKLIRPLVALYGDEVIPAMVRGVEASRLLGDLSERDYLEQLDFCEALEAGGAAYAGRWPAQRARELPAGTFLEPRVYDDPRVLGVARGRVEVEAGYLSPRVLGPGEAVAVPAGRMVGVRVLEEGAALWLGPQELG
jgi:hypothetical protein